MTSSEIRAKFLKYFEERGHAVIASSSLIPKDDPTLLFTNSGMVQFKNCFLGLEDRGYYRAASSQRCVRAGGKHNDLENVGYTARHHTFFEMLGNFSFGDYFKRESIAWGWDFLTNVMGLDKSKMYITIYEKDDDAFDIWNKEMGIPAERIFRMGMDTNFWMVGETGPCGPCSEILYDQGPEVGCGKPDCSVECSCDRHLELWNHVFTQFDRNLDGSFTPLPKPNIDTGMGLERLAAVVQGHRSNYDTDLFTPIIHHIAKLSGKKYRQNADNDVSMRVIADHARAVFFLIADGILPSNEGRGYVLRRILRRACRHGKLLGFDKPFLNEVVASVVDIMKDAYPESVDRLSFVQKVIFNEEQRFLETLDTGLRILTDEVAVLKKSKKTVIPGDVAFKLYDTYGFPVDLTADIVKKDKLTVDMDKFEALMEEQREKARESWKGSGDAAVADSYKKLSLKGIKSELVGYEEVTEATSFVTAILKKDEDVEVINEGTNAEIFTDQTPFYGETGGQVGDTGVIEGEGFLFEVWDTQRPDENLITHIGKLKKGTLRVGDSVHLKVQTNTRRATEANHSATHLLNAALHSVLGDHVKQAGSLVNPERLRFDFTHFSRIDEHELDRIETLANEYIQANLPVKTSVLDKEQAMKTGAHAVFDEKYSDKVRVVQMGKVSAELCGGTHVTRTGNIGILKILSESAVAAGVRRIEAVTGPEAVKYVKKVDHELKKVANIFKTGPLEVADRVDKLIKTHKDLEREIEALKGKLAAKESADIIKKARSVDGFHVLATTVEASDVKSLRDFGDKIRDKIKSGVILIGSKVGDKAMLLCMVTKDLTAKYDAGKIVKEIAPIVGGSGGGRPDMAQAGGTKPEYLDKAIAKLDAMFKVETKPAEKPTPAAKKPAAKPVKAKTAKPKAKAVKAKVAKPKVKTKVKPKAKAKKKRR
ncbi:MAG TPA: alanine--tRNA ligase [Syntrophales bacterium]|nr:alanine--tRNA ligase [Syntrophales bacterium]HOX94557.1 alanine--tRNA ligase [Syntrophales bacterium]HPI57429.1 alanine--tRNA ligase [Syntrophales bacterium]HPN25714.1 alanine--tRNA ligase [Syntrophales bacterium]HQM29454.1 alanine--tRNA ligase [Syntrophales bacterium]